MTGVLAASEVHVSSPLPEKEMRCNLVRNEPQAGFKPDGCPGILWMATFYRKLLYFSCAAL